MGGNAFIVRMTDTGPGCQRGSGVLILADIQNPPGHGSEQPAVADPALSRGGSGELNDLQGSLPTTPIL